MNTLTITEEEMLLSKDYSNGRAFNKAFRSWITHYQWKNERIKEAKNSILKSNEEVMKGANL